MSLNKKELTRTTNFANGVAIPNGRNMYFKNFGSPIRQYHQGGASTQMPPGHRHQADGEHYYGDESEGVLQEFWRNWASTRRNADGTPAADQRLHQYTVGKPLAYNLTDTFAHTNLTGDLEQDLQRFGTMAGRQYFDQTGDDLEYVTDDQGNFTGEIRYNPHGPNAEFISQQIAEHGYVPKPYIAEQKAVEVQATRSGRDKWNKLWSEVKASARTAKDLGLFKNAYGEDRIPLPQNMTTESLQAFVKDVGDRIKEHKRDVIQERQYKELSKKHDKGELSNTEYVAEIENKGLERFTPGYYEVDKQEFYDAMNQDFADKTESFTNLSRFVGAPIDAGYRLINEPAAAIESLATTTADAGYGLVGGGWAWGDKVNPLTGEKMFTNTGAVTDLLEVAGPLGSIGKATGVNKLIGPAYHKLYNTSPLARRYGNATFGFNPNIANLENKVNIGAYRYNRFAPKSFKIDPNKFTQRSMNFADKSLDIINRLPGTAAKNLNLENLSAAAHAGAQLPLMQAVYDDPTNELAWAGALGNTWSVAMPGIRAYQRGRFNRRNPMANEFPEFERIQRASEYQGRGYQFSPRYRAEGVDTDIVKNFGQMSPEQVRRDINLSERLSKNTMYKKQFEKQFGRTPDTRELMEYGYIQEASKKPNMLYPEGSAVELSFPYTRDVDLPSDLTPQANAAMSVYQGSQYGKSFQGTDKYADWLNQTAAPSLGYSLKKPQTLMRGVNLNKMDKFSVMRGGKDMGQLSWDELQPGDQFSFGRITSTEVPEAHWNQLQYQPKSGYDRDMPNFTSFGTGAISIDAPAGTRGWSGNNAANLFYNEREFALPRNTRFEVVSQPITQYKYKDAFINARTPSNVFEHGFGKEGDVFQNPVVAPNLQLRILSQRLGGSHRIPITQSMFKRF